MHGKKERRRMLRYLYSYFFFSFVFPTRLSMINPYIKREERWKAQQAIGLLTVLTFLVFIPLYHYHIHFHHFSFRDWSGNIFWSLPYSWHPRYKNKPPLKKSLFLLCFDIMYIYFLSISPSRTAVPLNKPKMLKGKSNEQMVRLGAHRDRSSDTFSWMISREV